MAGPQVKGMAIRGFLGAVERVHGNEAIDEMVPLLPEDIGTMLAQRSFISAGWYPLAHYRALLGAVMLVVGGGPEVVRELSRDGTLDDFRGIYRLLTAVLSPEFLMRRSPSLFNRYYDTGKLTVPVAKHGYAEARFRGCVGFDRVIWEDAVGGAIGILQACGAKDVSLRFVRGGGDGDEELDIIAQWK
jgi:hypothetical protein